MLECYIDYLRVPGEGSPSTLIWLQPSPPLLLVQEYCREELRQIDECLPADDDSVRPVCSVFVEYAKG